MSNLVTCGDHVHDCPILFEYVAALRQRVEELEREAGHLAVRHGQAVRYLRGQYDSIVEMKDRQVERAEAAEAKLAEAEKRMPYWADPAELMRRKWLESEAEVARLRGLNTVSAAELCKVENARLREEAAILRVELGVEYDAALRRAAVSGRAALAPEVKE